MGIYTFFSFNRDLYIIRIQDTDIKEKKFQRKITHLVGSYNNLNIFWHPLLFHWSLYDLSSKQDGYDKSMVSITILTLLCFKFQQGEFFPENLMKEAFFFSKSKTP